MVEFSNTTYPKARKDHICESRGHLQDFGLIRKYNESGVWYIVNADDYNISSEDQQKLIDFTNSGSKLPKGEKYLYCTGLYDGDFFTQKWNIEIYAIIVKYDLYFEE